MSPTIAGRADGLGGFVSANEMTSVGPEWPRCARFNRAMCRGETSAMDTRASRTRSARSTPSARSLMRARASGVRIPSAVTSTMRLTMRTSRLGLPTGPYRIARRGVGRPRFGAASLRRPELRRDATTRCRIVDARVVHPGQNTRELLLHLLELRLRYRGFAKLSLIEPLPHDSIDHFAYLLRRR